MGETATMSESPPMTTTDALIAVDAALEAIRTLARQTGRYRVMESIEEHFQCGRSLLLAFRDGVSPLGAVYYGRTEWNPLKPTDQRKNAAQALLAAAGWNVTEEAIDALAAGEADAIEFVYRSALRATAGHANRAAVQAARAFLQQKGAP